MGKGKGFGWSMADIDKLKQRGVKVTVTGGGDQPAVKKENAYQSLGRVKGRPMNKTEQAYADLLETRKRAGEITWYEYECINFRLADKCYYRPDFMVMTASGELQIHEVKARMITDDSLVKIKTAAEKFPFRFFMMKLEKGQWIEREF